MNHTCRDKAERVDTLEREIDALEEIIERMRTELDRVRRDVERIDNKPNETPFFGDR
jgi:prefoldin subunit 5